MDDEISNPSTFADLFEFEPYEGTRDYEELRPTEGMGCQHDYSSPIR
jgi:hypothetical protein